VTDCTHRVVLDGRERDCLETEPDHEVHKYRRTQGRDPFLYVQFVDLVNDAQVDVVPASGASASVPGAGTTTSHTGGGVTVSWAEPPGSEFVTSRSGE